MPLPLPTLCRAHPSPNGHHHHHHRRSHLSQQKAVTYPRAARARTPRRLCAALALALGAGLLGQPAAAATLTWNGGFGSPFWSARFFGLSNWNGGAVPQDGDELVFAGQTGLVNNNNDAGLSLSSLSFAAGAGAFTLNGLVPSVETRFTLTGHLGNQSASLQTINMGIDASRTGAPMLWDGGNQGLLVNGHLNLAHLTTVTLVNKTTLTDHSFVVGTLGQSTLNITSGSRVNSQQGAIGEGSSSSDGSVTVTGVNSLLVDTGNLRVGVNGGGRLAIDSGGRVTSSYGTLGQQQQGRGTASVTGANSAWIVARTLAVGDQGRGTLSILDGALVSSSLAKIGGTGGRVSVTGANSRWIIDGGLDIDSGSGESQLNVYDGGFVSSGDATVGKDGRASIFVTGANSRWAVAGHLALGFNAQARMDILSGSQVTSNSASLGNGGVGTSGNHVGRVTIAGPGSAWINAGVLDIGKSGTRIASLAIEAGATAATGSLVIGNYGVLDLNGGTLQIHDAAVQGAGQFNWASGTLRFTNALATLGAGALQLDSITTLPAGKALEFSHSFAVGSGNQLHLAGGTLGGSGSLLNDGHLAGFGQLAGSGGFTNSGLLMQGGGNLVLSNTGPNRNTGNWDLATGWQLQLAGATLTNHGSIQLNSATLSGTGTLVNAAGGTVLGRGSITANFSNAGALVVDAGTTQVSQAFNNSGQIQLSSNAATLAGGMLSNSGQIEGRGRVGNDVNNTGVLQALSGTLTFAGALAHTGSGVIAAGSGAKVLVMAGLARNEARIQLDGGTFDNNGAPLLNAANGSISGFGTVRSGALVNDGQILLASGTSAVHANLLAHAGSQTILSGQGNTSFYGAVEVQGGAELRVSQGTVATFFGLVNQRSGARFTGTGQKYFEGGLAVGNSPGLGRDAGSVTFGAGNTYTADIGGTDPGDALGNGIQFDRYEVAGTLHFGGTLAVVAWNGFAPLVGQRFDLFDWGSSQGRFAMLDFAQAPLAAGLVWDTSRLYVDGSLAVAAVPEPGSTSLLLAGLGVLGWLARRQPRACAGACAG